MITDVHVKATGAACNDLADAAQAHDAQALAADAGGERVGRFEPFFLARVAVRGAHAACHVNHQAHGDVGHAVVQDLGGVADLNLAALRLGDSDGFIADAKRRDHFQSGQGVDQRGAGTYAGRGDQAFKLSAVLG